MKHRTFTRKQLNELVLQMPFNHHLGFRVSHVHKDGLTMEVEIQPTHFNILGTLHGGLTATLVDVSIGMSLMVALGGQPITTTDLTISYLRPVAEGKVRARGKVIKAGKTLSVGSAEVRDAHGRLIATAMGTYMAIPAEQKLKPRA